MVELIVFQATHFQWTSRIKFLLSRGWKPFGTIGRDSSGGKYQIFIKRAGG